MMNKQIRYKRNQQIIFYFFFSSKFVSYYYCFNYLIDFFGILINLLIQIQKKQEIEPMNEPNIICIIQVKRVNILFKFQCKMFVGVSVFHNKKVIEKFQTKIVDLQNGHVIFQQNFNFALRSSSDPQQSILEIEYIVNVEAPNGVRMAGKAIDVISSKDLKKNSNYINNPLIKSMQLEKCADRKATIELAYSINTLQTQTNTIKPIVTQSNTNTNTYSEMKTLENELMKISHKLSLLEIASNQKDLIIKNLNLELQLKQQENKFLFSAEKLKEVANVYQLEIKELKNKVFDLQGQNKVLKRNNQSIALAMKKQKFQANITMFSKLLTNLENKIFGFVKEAVSESGSLVGNSRRKEDPEYEGQTIMHSHLQKFEKGINLLTTRYQNQIKKSNDLTQELQSTKSELQSSKEKFIEISQQNMCLQEQIIQNEFQAQKSREIIQEIQAKVLHLQELAQKENTEHKVTTEKITQEKLILKSHLEELEKIIENTNFKHKEELCQRETNYTEKISHLTQMLEESQKSLNILNEKLQSQRFQFSVVNQKLSRLEFEIQVAENQKQQYKRQLEQLKQEILQLEGNLSREKNQFTESASKSKNSLQELTHVNISIIESYNKLKMEASYRLNQQIAQKEILKSELEEIQIRHQIELQGLQERINELQSLELETIALCSKLGFPETTNQLTSILGSRSKNGNLNKTDLEYLTQQNKQLTNQNSKLRKEIEKLQKSFHQLEYLLITPSEKNIRSSQ